MNKLYYKFLLITLLLIGLTSSALAGDGKRKGFILGLGFGPGFVIPKVKSGAVSIALDKKMALMSNFKIGYAPSDKLMIYWSSKVNWYGLETDFIDKITFAFGQGGIGVTYFLLPEVQSFYVSSGIGFSTLSAPFEEDVESNFGFGFFLGGGYEFAKHWNAELNLIWGNPGESDFGERVAQNTLVFSLSVNYLLY